MTTHCAICQRSWTPESGVVVGHPVELHVCDECFDADISPILAGHNVSAARPTEAPCLASWVAGDTRIGVTIPGNNPLDC